MARRRRRRRCGNQNLTDKKAAGDDTHDQSNSKKETESRWESLDFDNDVNGGTYDEDSDMQLQEALFNSIQNMEFDFPAKRSLINDDVKKKGVDTSCRLLKTSGKRMNDWKNSTREKGEPSCVYCTICKEPRPVVNDTMKRGGCGHIYCEECIISYGRERIRENIMEVNCPVSNCNEVFVMNEYFVPYELMDQWRDAVSEARALASCDIIECPFGDCSGNLIDDKRGFLIRACPKCWRIFCVRCRVDWHMGMQCETYQLQRKIRPLSIKIFPNKNDDDDEEEEEEEGTDDDQQGNVKVLSLDEFLKLF